jgi:hypothetical protein
MLLTKWWVATSTDPVTNTGQKREGMWVRIQKGYNSQRARFPERTLRSLNNCWDIIKAECNLFSYQYTQVIRVNPSGYTDADKV